MGRPRPPVTAKKSKGSSGDKRRKSGKAHTPAPLPSTPSPPTLPRMDSDDDEYFLETELHEISLRDSDNDNDATAAVTIATATTTTTTKTHTKRVTTKSGKAASSSTDHRFSNPCSPNFEFLESPRTLPRFSVVKSDITVHPINIAFAGDANSGKTSIIYNARFHDGLYPTQTTVGVDLQTIFMVIGGIRVQINLYDLAGDDRMLGMSTVVIKKAEAAVVVYDSLQPDSARSVGAWEAKLRADIQIGDFALAFACNKIDLARPAQPLPGLLEFVDSDKYELRQRSHFYTSAKTGIGTRDMIAWLAKSVIEQRVRYDASYLDEIDASSRVDIAGGGSGNGVKRTGGGCCSGTGAVARPINETSARR